MKLPPNYFAILLVNNFSELYFNIGSLLRLVPIIFLQNVSNRTEGFNFTLISSKLFTLVFSKFLFECERTWNDTSDLIRTPKLSLFERE